MNYNKKHLRSSSKIIIPTLYYDDAREYRIERQATLDIQLFRVRSFYKRGKAYATWQCRKLLWVMVVFTVAWVNLKVFQRGGRKQRKHVFVFFFPCCWITLNLNQVKPNSHLPIMPIGIVAYACTFSWDNLCLNSCILDVALAKCQRASIPNKC